MAWLEKRRGTYHINFFHGGRHCSRSLKTGNERKAESLRVRFEDTLADVERGRLEVPPDADLAAFLLSEGKAAAKVVVAKAAALGEFFRRYQAEVPTGSKDQSTRYIEDIHISHLLRLIGQEVRVRSITTEVLQGYVARRSEEGGLRGGSVSHVTIQKELGTFAAIWNKWGFPLGARDGAGANARPSLSQAEGKTALPDVRADCPANRPQKAHER